MPQLENLAKREHAASLLVTLRLVNEMKSKSLDTNYSESTDELLEILKQRVSEYKEHQQHILEKVDKKTARVLEQISEPGSSNWLSCLPLRKHGFVLNKSKFRDSTITVSMRKSVWCEPCLNCHLGGYIIIRHNAVRDFWLACWKQYAQILRLNVCFKNRKESSSRRHQHLQVTRQDPTLGTWFL